MEQEARAIPLIEVEEESKQLKVCQEAVDLLTQIEGPIAVISVAGMYRTGKSYLLNRMLLQRSTGFGVGPTINPCTKGMWLWSKPITFRKQTEGERQPPLNVLIVDTEGIGSTNEEQNHDVRIFSLAVLLSSFFIYNSVGTIDETALSNLSLVCNLTKHIQVRASSSDQMSDDLSKHFPQFMWVLRDFALQLINENGEQMTCDDYLEKALTIPPGSDMSDEKNKVRKVLRELFTQRECQTIIRPLTNEDQLQRLAELDFSELRPEFVAQVGQLRSKVFDNLKPKQMNGVNLDGSMLAELA